MIVSREMEEVARFSIDTRRQQPRALFSPEGQTIALSAADTVYLVPVQSARPVVLFEVPPGDDGPDRVVLSTPGVNPWRLSVRAEGGTRHPPWEYHYFTWDGVRLPDSGCVGIPAPDGRHAITGQSGASHSVVEGAYWVYVRTEQGVEGWVSHDYREHD